MCVLSDSYSVFRKISFSWSCPFIFFIGHIVNIYTFFLRRQEDISSCRPVYAQPVRLKQRSLLPGWHSIRLWTPLSRLAPFCFLTDNLMVCFDFFIVPRFFMVEVHQSLSGSCPVSGNNRFRQEFTPFVKHAVGSHRRSTGLRLKYMLCDTAFVLQPDIG